MSGTNNWRTVFIAGLDARANIAIREEGMFSASPVEAAARDVGVDVFLRKPQDIGSLAETINRLLEERDQEQ